MTKEQAIEMLKAKRECIELDTKGNAELCDRNCGECELYYKQGNMGEQKQALELAIKALEQQPSDDCVSRKQALLQLTGVNLSDKTTEELIGLFGRRINELPPVTPTFPKGTTNGDMIKAMFPKIEIYTDVINEIVDVEICEDSSELRCFIDWWNAPYRRGDENG